MIHRPRILRSSASIRAMIRENQISINDFVVPLFLDSSMSGKTAIPSLPNYYRHSLPSLLDEIDELMNLGLNKFLLFAKINDELKDNTGKEALNTNGLYPKAIQEIKKRFPQCLLMTDIALDPFSVFGHDGIVSDEQIINDQTVSILSKMAILHAQCGADLVAPSDMMDGRIGAIRTALEENNLHQTGILAYSAKYASVFYGPFRDALDSAPGFGDKKSYQMDPANRLEAIKEVTLDIQEGADIVLIKPAGPYLDIIREVKNKVTVPVAAYQVSGEYAMIHAAAERGWVNLTDAMLESLIGIKRAGADIIITYFAKEFAKNHS